MQMLTIINILWAFDLQKYLIQQQKSESISIIRSRSFAFLSEEFVIYLISFVLFTSNPNTIIYTYT